MQDTIPISLYIELETGHRADLAVVARAAIAWSDAIREIAYVIDPSIEIRLEFDSGTPGSLSLNSLIRKIKETPGVRADLRTIAISVFIWFFLQGASYTFSEVMDFLLGKDAPPAVRELTPQELEELANSIADKVKKSLAQPQRQQFYRELGSGPIKGIPGGVGM